MSRIKLTVENKTSWSTSDIRRIALAGMKAHGLRIVHLIVRYRRRTSGCLGRAYVGERRRQHESGFVSYRPAITMWLHMEREPLSVMIATAVLPLGAMTYAEKVAATFDHECYHLRGLHHRNFPKHVLERGHKAPWFEEGMVLRWDAAEEKPALSVDERSEVRLAHSRAMLEKAETRLKRARTIHQKWARRVKDGERRLAARRSP